MTQTETDRTAQLEAQEAGLVLASFDHSDAWRLGTAMVERALRDRLSVIIDIRGPGVVLFRAALAGTTAENQAWLDRKAETVFRFEASTALLSERFAAQGVDVWTAPWFDTNRYTTAGGSVPVRVMGVGVVAAVTVSGLTSEEDHDFAVEALDAFRRTRSRGPLSQYRTLAPGQQAQIWVGGPTIREPQLLFQTNEMLIEAPNWSLDGDSLFLNGHGSLWRLDLSAPDRGLTVVDFDGLPELNNDHVLDPDGDHIYLSAMDGHIYRGRLDGGAVERVTPEDGAWHFLHGVSPDRTRLSYVHIDDLAHPGRLAVMEPHGQPVLVHTGTGHLDGPEWSPDGAWIYVNTEAFTDKPGHAQIARIADADGSMERLVTSDTVDWFPHLSPDAQHAAYISFPAGDAGSSTGRRRRGPGRRHRPTGPIRCSVTQCSAVKGRSTSTAGRRTAVGSRSSHTRSARTPRSLDLVRVRAIGLSSSLLHSRWRLASIGNCEPLVPPGHGWRDHRGRLGRVHRAVPVHGVAGGHHLTCRHFRFPHQRRSVGAGADPVPTSRRATSLWETR